LTPRSAVAAIHQYLREVVGEADYDRYVTHQLREHPGVPPMCRRDFERQKTRRREETPQARCC
jgi:uncharacterized short protein YbdD (DUF466 family)